MSEIKRAQLLPLGSQKESDKPSKEPRKTVRISVALPESTEDTCPEYNYKDELAAAKKLGKYKELGGRDSVNGLNRLDEFGDDDDDVKRIARQMEEKYGTGTSLKKKRKGRKDDYADIGMGYDESDSFIDNTDGYDEMIPQNVTTLHGGFYINSGALEFKTDDEAESDFSSSSSDDETSRKPASRKRVIESSDETDRENKTDATDNPTAVEKKRKLQNGGNGLQQSLKKKLLSPNKIYIKKRRIIEQQKKTVKELLREKREDLNMSIPEELKHDITVDEEQKEKKAMSISSVTDTIESVVKASGEETKPPESQPPKTVVNSSSDGESSHDISTKVIKSEVKLPENLSADILSVITAIKTAAEHCNLDGKNNFTSEINLLILRLERKSKCLGKPSKMKVYEHLAACLKCKTETLTRRANSLVLDDEQKKLKNVLSGLQSEINKIMPSLLESYEKESKRILQKKFSQESVENEENKCLRMPKRRFQWNDVTKKQLKDILLLKKRCLLLEGKAKDVLDTQMTTFLKTEIQVLWPEGWMSMNALNKIYSMYADPKRMLNGSNPPSTTTAQTKPETSTTTTTVKNLPQSFNNSNLSITPIITPPPKSESNTNKLQSAPSEVSVSRTETSINLSLKPLPETPQLCDISPASPPKKEMEVKLKVKPPSELLKPPVSNHVNKKESTISLISDDSVIIVDSAPRNDRFSPSKDKFHAKSDDNYCQVIDLSDKNDFKVKPEPKLPPKREKTISPMIPDPMSHVSKHHELSITPSYPKVEPPKPKTTCAGDDIQKVMENLKVLQKMSSPKKTVEASPTSSAVSVIAVNKSFAPKPVHNESSSSSSTMQRYDYNKPEYPTSFQDEFQKQLFSALSYTSTPNKNYNSIDRYPHIASSGSSMVPGDKYFQSANNNYPQSSNGHKSGTSAQQSATAPKSQQK